MLQVHGLRPADAQKRTPAKTVIEDTITIIKRFSYFTNSAQFNNTKRLIILSVTVTETI